MSESLLSSITASLEAMPHNTLVINRYGVIQYANSRWNAFCTEYGLPHRKEWSGENSLELFQEFIVDPNYRVILRESLQNISLGKSLLFSKEFSISTSKQGDRNLRLDAFPLLSDLHSVRGYLIISITDLGPVRTSPKSLYQPKLIPICASCKSIRNDNEEWLRTEHFLQQKLSMQFTHDICPHCIRRLYPKYAGALKSMTEVK